jgi:hypothetical protein
VFPHVVLSLPSISVPYPDRFPPSLSFTLTWTLACFCSSFFSRSCSLSPLPPSLRLYHSPSLPSSLTHSLNLNLSISTLNRVPKTWLGLSLP